MTAEPATPTTAEHELYQKAAARVLAKRGITTGPRYEKAIAYDRESRDYAMYLDGELVGFARSYHDAEVYLDQLIFELRNGEYFREAQV